MAAFTFLPIPVHPTAGRDHYIIDLACRTAKLAVELDGAHHADQLAADEARTRYLEANGWVVLRFWNSEVFAKVDGVMKAILLAVSRRSTHPRPLPSREGRARAPRSRLPGN